MNKLVLCAAAVCGLAFASSASAMVSSTCASATTCTFTELDGGETLTVDDVTLSFVAGSTADLGSKAFEPDDATITGSSGGTTAVFDFAFLPSLGVSATGDFISYVFDALASVDAGSSRVLVDAALSFTGTELDFTGDAASTVIFAIDSFASFLEIYDDSAFGTAMTSSATLADLTSLDISGSIDLIDFDGISTAGITGFTFTLTLEDPTPEIPLPAAAWLFIGGIGALKAFGRRKKKIA